MEDKYKLNRQLQEKFGTNQAFKKKMQQREKNYIIARLALQNNEDLNICEEMLEVFAIQKNYDVFFYYALMQPKSKAMTPKLTLFIIKYLMTQPRKKYKFVFFNNCVDNKQIYYEFKNIFLTLPLQYFLALDQFIFVKPFFSQKVTQMWTNDQIEKYFKSKTRYVNNFKELCSALETQESSLVQFLPKQIIEDEFPGHLSKIKPNYRTSIADHRINLMGQQRTYKQKNQFKSFLQDISNFLKKSSELLEIDEYETNEANLPLILQELFGYFEENPDRIKEEGLFRKSVSIDEENETLNQLMKSNFQYLKKVENSHLVASLIKRFFMKLKIPIFPYSIFHRLMDGQGVMNTHLLIKQQIDFLAPKNYFPLLFLFEFLIQKILPEEKYTRMDSKNLSICFAPCLLRSEKASEKDLIYATKSTQIIKSIFDNFEDIFGNKLQRENKIRSTVESSRVIWEQQLQKEIKSLSESEGKSERQSFSQ